MSLQILFLLLFGLTSVRKPEKLERLDLQCNKTVSVGNRLKFIGKNTIEKYCHNQWEIEMNVLWGFCSHPWRQVDNLLHLWVAQ